MNENETQNPVENTSEQNPAPEISAAPAPELQTPVKRKRGRPPKNAPQLETLGATGAQTEAPKKRQKTSADKMAGFARQIQGLHQLTAMVTGVPEIMLSDAESQALAESVINMADQYDLAIDGKTGAALQLLGTAAMIYGPRFFAFKGRMAQNAVKSPGVMDVEARSA